MTIGEIIKKYRKSHHLSQRQFALRCNVSNGYISMLERGYNPKTGEPIVPTLVRIKKIADAMNMDIDDLISLSEDIPILLSEDDLDVSILDDSITSPERVSTVSERLRLIMSERKLKQSNILDLAKPYCDAYHIKLGKSDLSQFVSGKTEPGQSKLTILSLALDVSELWLMGYDVHMEREVVNTNHLLLGKIVKWYREAHSLSTRRFAEICGLSCGYVSMLENHKNPSTSTSLAPNLETLSKLANGMKMSLNELIQIISNEQVISSTAQNQDASSDDNKRPSLTPHENTVITAYREQPAVQPTVDRLLGVSQNAEVIPLSHIIRIAGRDGYLEEHKLTDEQIDLIRRMIQQMPDFED